MGQIDVRGEIRNAARRIQPGGKLSVRTREKAAIKVAEHYAEMTEKLAGANTQLANEGGAVRYASHQYRRRWIRTMIALGYVAVAVAVWLVSIAG